MARKKISTTVYVTEDQDRALKQLCGITKVPIAEFIRQGIDLLLAERGHLLAERVAEAAVDSKWGVCVALGCSKQSTHAGYCRDHFFDGGEVAGWVPVDPAKPKARRTPCDVCRACALCLVAVLAEMDRVPVGGGDA